MIWSSCVFGASIVESLCNSLNAKHYQGHSTGILVDGLEYGSVVLSVLVGPGLVQVSSSLIWSLSVVVVAAVIGIVEQRVLAVGLIVISRQM